MIIEPNYLRSLSFPELKKQYTKSRSKMQKRKDRLDAAGFHTTFQTFVNKWGQSGKIPTIASIKRSTGNNKTQMINSMVYIIAELERYAEDPRTSLMYQKRQRKELAEEFQESGYNVNSDNVEDFLEFLDWMHNSNLDHVLYIETYEEGERGYGRAKRRERTEKEKERVMELFKLWQENDGSLSEEILKEYL